MSSNLSSAFLRRFERIHDLADLDRAVQSSRNALARTPRTHANQAPRLANLGNALLKRFEASHRAEDIDEAVALLTDAAAIAARDARILANLAAALRTRFEHRGDPADLEESIRWSRVALQETGANHPDRATILSGLRLALQRRHDQSHHLADHDDAIAALRDATHMPNARTSTRFGAALAWASAAATAASWELAMDGYAMAVELMPVLASRGATWTSREALLSQAHRVAANGAACAVLAGQPGRAVALVDQGRAVLWSQLLTIRGDLSAIRAKSPELADRLAAVAGALNSYG